MNRFIKKLTNSTKAIISILSEERREIVNKILSLEIEKYGICDKIPFIKLLSGEIFYGYQPSHSQIAQYYLNYFRLHNFISLSVFGVATDIVIRYKGYGLKYNGPNKEAFYTPKTGDTVAEMGAYLGHYIVRLSKLVGNEGTVFAIEPIPDNLNILNKVITENNLNNVIVVPFGISNLNGTTNINIEDNGGQANSILGTGAFVKRTIEIKVKTLSTIFGEHNVSHLDFIVIQLNGNEFDALLGMDGVTAENISIAARYNKENASNPQENITSLMSDRGYFSKVIDNDFIFISQNESTLNK